MSSTFSIDSFSESENEDLNSVLGPYKLNLMLKLMDIKSNFTEKQIIKDLGCSGWTIKRYRNDINMNSPYKRNKNPPTIWTKLS